MGSTGPTTQQAVSERVRLVEMSVQKLEAWVKAGFLARDREKKMEALPALAARVAELEKPWYRKVGGAKASGQREAGQSTLLQRMEALNS